MKVNLLAFGIAADLLGGRRVVVELDNGSTTADLRMKLENAHPELKSVLRYSIAVNRQYVTEDIPLDEKHEIAIIPPVSGG